MAETPTVDDLTKEIAHLRMKLSAGVKAKLTVTKRTAISGDSLGTNTTYASGTE